MFCVSIFLQVKKEEIEEEEEEEESSQIRKVQLKGKAPVDPECGKASSCHVFCDDEAVWDCMLNQTNIQNNNNKYYLIQVRS